MMLPLKVPIRAAAVVGRSPRPAGVQVDAYGTVRCLDGQGGDFLRIHRRQRQLGVTLADVSGHGPAAAPYSERFSQALSELDEVRRNRRLWLSRLNRRLCRRFDDEHFGAVISVAVRPMPGSNEYTASVANAGMPRPYLYRAREGDVVRIGSVSPPLGVFDDDAHLPQPQRVRMSRGDVLVMMSDGALEALEGYGSASGPFGRVPRRAEGVQAILKAAAPGGGRLVHDALATALERRIRGREQADDASFAVIEIRRPESAAASAA